MLATTIDRLRPPTLLLLAFCFFCRCLYGQPDIGTNFDNHFLSMKILPGWEVSDSIDNDLTLTQGKYRLTINPIFEHASPVNGGRFSEIVEGVQSIDAVMGSVEQPAGGRECTQQQSDKMIVTKEISLQDLYTDSSKRDSNCTFPSSGHSVWFGSYFSGSTGNINDPQYREYTITLAYDTNNVNSLPQKGNPELKRVFSEVVAMLRTLHLKPPITILRIDPPSASPGATVTIYGSGFNLTGTNVRFSEFPNETVEDVKVSADGQSLTFHVPTSINVIGCNLPMGRQNCFPVLINHVDVNKCPTSDTRVSHFCGMGIPPATYQVSVTAEGVSSGPVSFTVAPPAPSEVTISLVYSNYLVSPGDTITIIGRGFAVSGNTVRIGSALVSDLPSADGKTIVFRAPKPAGTSLLNQLEIYKLSVFNAAGESNSIIFWYR